MFLLKGKGVGLIILAVFLMTIASQNSESSNSNKAGKPMTEQKINDPSSHLCRGVFLVYRGRF